MEPAPLRPRRVLVVGPDAASTALLSEGLLQDGLVIAQVSGLDDLPGALEAAPVDALAVSFASGAEAGVAAALAALRAREDGLRHLPVLLVAQGPLAGDAARLLREDRRAWLVEEPYRISDLRRRLVDALDGGRGV